MKFLQLEGEAAQLRQVAKAFAAGDISREDYRHIRAAIIDAFVLDNSVVTLVTNDANDTNDTRGTNDTVRPVARARSVAVAADADSGWALLAIVGAGAMLVIVAMLAILLA